MITRRSLFKFLAVLPLARLALPKSKPEPQFEGFKPGAFDGMSTGDVFTLRGIYTVNPQTFKPIGTLRQFVYCGKDTYFPMMVTKGPYTNVHVTEGPHTMEMYRPSRMDMIWGEPYHRGV